MRQPGRQNLVKLGNCTNTLRLTEIKHGEYKAVRPDCAFKPQFISSSNVIDLVQGEVQFASTLFNSKFKFSTFIGKLNVSPNAPIEVGGAMRPTKLSTSAQIL